MRSILANYDSILLDMNETFMFDADSFGPQEDYSICYRSLGGQSPPEQVNRIIADAFNYLEHRYAKPEYHECFPRVAEAMIAVENGLSENAGELDLLVNTFANHEMGRVPVEFQLKVLQLTSKFPVALVVDIWAPSDIWKKELTRLEILNSCKAFFFSSDYGIVKPSPEPFRHVCSKMQARPERTLMIGDSVRRDLGGAIAAGIDCILVGGAHDPRAVACLGNILEL